MHAAPPHDLSILRCRGPGKDPGATQAAYEDIAATEKPNFPEGEQSVQDR